jgi:hypothetical protein
MKLKKSRQNKIKKKIEKHKKISLFELQNSPKALLFRVRA